MSPNIKDRAPPPVTEEEAPFVYPQRAPKSAYQYTASSEIADKYGIDHPLLKKLEHLGGGGEQVKQAIHNILQEKDKSFLAKVMDKLKAFLSRFMPVGY